MSPADGRSPKMHALSMASLPLEEDVLREVSMDPLLSDQLASMGEEVSALLKRSNASGYIDFTEPPGFTPIDLGSKMRTFTSTPDFEGSAPEASPLSPSSPDGHSVILTTQVRALGQALAGLGAKAFNWSAGLSKVQRRDLAEVILDYCRPCAHLDFCIEELCADLEQIQWVSTTKKAIEVGMEAPPPAWVHKAPPFEDFSRASSRSLSPHEKESLELRFSELRLHEVDQQKFKAELRNGLRSLGLTEGQVARLDIDLKPGSVIAVIRGNPRHVEELRQLPMHRLRVMGCVPQEALGVDSSPRKMPDDVTARRQMQAQLLSRGDALQGLDSKGIGDLQTFLSDTTSSPRGRQSPGLEASAWQWPREQAPFSASTTSSPPPLGQLVVPAQEMLPSVAPPLARPTHLQPQPLPSKPDPPSLSKNGRLKQDESVNADPAERDDSVSAERDVKPKSPRTPMATQAEALKPATKLPEPSAPAATATTKLPDSATATAKTASKDGKGGAAGASSSSPGSSAQPAATKLPEPSAPAATADDAASDASSSSSGSSDSEAASPASPTAADDATAAARAVKNDPHRYGPAGSEEGANSSPTSPTSPKSAPAASGAKSSPTSPKSAGAANAQVKRASTATSLRNSLSRFGLRTSSSASK